MDVFTLTELSSADPQRITIEATVTTGFESVAISEFREMFGNDPEICRSRGRIFFNVAVTDLPKVHTMRSIDNLFVVANAISSIGFGDADSENDLQIIMEHARTPDWKKVFAVWKENVAYRGICYPTKDQYTLSCELEQELIAKARLIATDRHESSNTNGCPARSCDCSAGRDSENSSGRCDAWTNEGPVSKGCQRRSELEQARLNALVTQAYNELDERPPSQKVLKYRVTCYRRGKNSFGSQDAAERFGGQLQDSYSWIVDLERFDLEIVLNIRSDQVYVCVALTTASKHRRNIAHFGPTTLRATVCHNLLRLGEPRVGDVIVDPLCGGGSIPIEGALGWAGTYHMGGDSHPKAVQRAADNLRDLVLPSASRHSKPDILAWDATNLPLRDNSVDLFVSDLPFGRRSGSKKDNRVLYREVLQDLARVVNTTRGRAVLLTEDKRSFMKAVTQLRALWKLNKTLSVNIGGLDAAAYVLSRSK